MRKSYSHKSLKKIVNQFNKVKSIKNLKTEQTSSKNIKIEKSNRPSIKNKLLKVKKQVSKVRPS